MEVGVQNVSEIRETTADARLGAAQGLQWGSRPQQCSLCALHPLDICAKPVFQPIPTLACATLQLFPAATTARPAPQADTQTRLDRLAPRDVVGRLEEALVELLENSLGIHQEEIRGVVVVLGQEVLRGWVRGRGAGGWGDRAVRRRGELVGAKGIGCAVKRLAGQCVARAAQRGLGRQ